MDVSYERERTGAEVVFVLMRTLLAGRLLWGADSAVSLVGLRTMLRANRAQVARALSYLRDEGMVRVDRRRGVVRLTERAFREMLR